MGTLWSNSGHPFWQRTMRCPQSLVSRTIFAEHNRHRSLPVESRPKLLTLVVCLIFTSPVQLPSRARAQIVRRCPDRRTVVLNNHATRSTSVLDRAAPRGSLKASGAERHLEERGGDLSLDSFCPRAAWQHLPIPSGC